jgi:hypothetical protein
MKGFTESELKNNKRYILLQVACTFWLFEITITEFRKERSKIRYYDGWYMYYASNYSIELVDCWRNYSKERKLFELELLGNHWRDKKDIRYSIDHNNHSARDCLLNDKSKEGEIKHDIPILKETGLGNYIDHMTLFYSIEEYFSMEKTASETTEPKGATNDDKIIMHGFDTKSSFRKKKSKGD